MNNKLIAMLMLASLCSLNTVYAASNYSFQQTQTQPVYNSQYVQQPMQYSSSQPLHGNVVMVPAGTALPAMLTAPLSSANASPGQTVTMALNSDFYYNNKLIAPAGSTISGTVIEASKAKRGSMNGKLSIRFTQIFTPYGTQIPISAVIKTDDNTGVLIGGTKLDVTKEYAKEYGEEQRREGMKAGIKTGIETGIETGIQTGRRTEIFLSVQDGDYSVNRGAEKLGMSVDEFEKSMSEAGYRVPELV